MDNMGKQTLEQWWVEDAERVNGLVAIAKAAHAPVGTTPVPPPLQEDGTLKETSHEGQTGRT